MHNIMPAQYYDYDNSALPSEDAVALRFLGGQGSTSNGKKLDREGFAKIKTSLAARFVAKFACMV